MLRRPRARTHLRQEQALLRIGLRLVLVSRLRGPRTRPGRALAPGPARTPVEPVLSRHRAREAPGPGRRLPSVALMPAARALDLPRSPGPTAAAVPLDPRRALHRCCRTMPGPPGLAALRRLRPVSPVARPRPPRRLRLLRTARRRLAAPPAEVSSSCRWAPGVRALPLVVLLVLPVALLPAVPRRLAPVSGPSSWAWARPRIWPTAHRSRRPAPQP